MKQFLSLVLAMVMLLSMTTVTAFAEVESVAFAATTVEGKVGDTVTVDITISENHYMVNGQIRIHYDASALELIPVSEGTIANYNTDVLGAGGMCVIASPMAGRVNFAYVSAADVGKATGGAVFSLQFKILENANVENVVRVEVREFNSNDTGDGVPDDYPKAVITNGAVKVTDMVQLGDLNNDGEVNIADATMLFRGVNGRVDLTDEQKVLSDLNKDDEVNIADATMLFRYVNGRISTFG